MNVKYRFLRAHLWLNDGRFNTEVCLNDAFDRLMRFGAELRQHNLGQSLN